MILTWRLHSCHRITYSIVGIVGGSIVAVQLLTVIIGGVHANSAKKTKENDIEMPLTVFAVAFDDV